METFFRAVAWAHSGTDCVSTIESPCFRGPFGECADPTPASKFKVPLDVEMLSALLPAWRAALTIVNLSWQFGQSVRERERLGKYLPRLGLQDESTPGWLLGFINCTMSFSA